MPFQGDLETLPLPDVLRLLAATGKTGGLQVTGANDGAPWDATVWLVDGRIAGAGVGEQSTTAVDAIFQALRLDQGSFAFESGAFESRTAESGSAGAPEESDDLEVEPVLEEASANLEEWHEALKLVPSLDAWLELRDTDEETVQLTRRLWGGIVAIGSGNSVRRLGAQLELGELDSVRLARDLVESGVVAVTEPPADVRPIEPGAVEEAGEPVAAEVAGEPAGSEEHAQPAESGEEYEPVVPGSLSGGWQEYHGWDHAGPVSQDGERAVEQPAETSPWAQAGQLVPAEPGAVPPVPGSTWGDESGVIAQQLAGLNPEAARAVAAAAMASTVEEREAALLEAERADENFDRTLLLKFLGAVEG